MYLQAEKLQAWTDTYQVRLNVQSDYMSEA